MDRCIGARFHRAKFQALKPTTLEADPFLPEQNRPLRNELYVNSHRKLIKLKNAVEREQFELDTLLEKKTVDDAKVRKQFKQLESARTDLANERLGFVIGVREIIGAERFQQLKTSYKKWR